MNLSSTAPARRRATKPNNRAVWIILIILLVVVVVTINGFGTAAATRISDHPRATPGEKAIAIGSSATGWVGLFPASFVPIVMEGRIKTRK